MSNPIGRPVKYKTPEEMQVKIDLYFDEIKKHKQEYGFETMHPTVTGLAIAIDLTREGLLHYCEKTDDFADTIKKAKAKVEAYIEQRLYGNNVTGCIFNLKNNFGWKDKTEQQVTSNNIETQAEYIKRRLLESNV